MHEHKLVYTIIFNRIRRSRDWLNLGPSDMTKECIVDLVLEGTVFQQKCLAASKDIKSQTSKIYSYCKMTRKV